MLCVPIFCSALILSICYFHCTAIIRNGNSRQSLFWEAPPTLLPAVNKTPKAINADSLVFAHDQAVGIYLRLRAIAILTPAPHVCALLFSLDSARMMEQQFIRWLVRTYPSAQRSLFNSGADPDCQPFCTSHTESVPCIFASLGAIGIPHNVHIFV
jgi:hypothetical protein